MNANECQHVLDRRRFLRSAAVGGAGLAFAPTILHADAQANRPEPINVALIGAGAQGQLLMAACLKIPGVRFNAVCDIWEAYNLKRTARMLQRYDHPAVAYTDFEQMLGLEKDLDAVIVATPDCWHARHTLASLNKSLHVYCETPMSNTPADAHRMVEAARRTGKLLQIGHQRRSNPRYLYCHDKILGEMKLLGQVIAANGQWHRSAQPPLGWPKGLAVYDEILQQYGYASMHQLRNWRWYKGFGAGPAVELGSQQLDVCNWFLGTRPTSVLASSRGTYYRREGFEWSDTVMAIYEYDTPEGPVNVSYRILSANSSFQHFEAFMGDQGTLVLSEAAHLGETYRELSADEKVWAKWAQTGYLQSPAQLQAMERDLAWPVYLVGETPPPLASKQLPYKLPVRLDRPPHQLHLENFFDAIRGKAKLNCPAEVGYETAVTVLKVNEAAATGRKLEFRPEDFIV